MRKIDSIIIHHSVTPKAQTLEKSIKSFNTNHYQRIAKPNKQPIDGYGYYIQYHYIIAGNGAIAKTRPEAEVGFHASNLPENERSIGVCLIGNFDVEKPNPEQLWALRDLIKKIKATYYIIEVSGHRKYAKKSCPGKNMTDKMILEAFKPTK